MIEPAIKFDDVSKSFGDTLAVDALTLTIPRGSVTVFLGPNGAGKTTTVRLTTGALVPDVGEITVLGLSSIADGHEVRKICGVVPPNPAFFDQLSGIDNLKYAAEIAKAPKRAIAPAAERFGITDALHRRVDGYSTGMRTRLALARAVLHDPEILLLDEPTAGLDPESSRAVLGLIREMAGKGQTIVMCTHLLHEAEGIADVVVLMGSGQARAVGNPHDLMASYASEKCVAIDAVDRSELAILANMPGVLAVNGDGPVKVTVEDMSIVPDLVKSLVDKGVDITRVEPHTPTLEYLYFEMQSALGDQL
ncbi:putative ABC transporter ATP-binding protein YxlF [bacterium BMS3Bbin02]|nr:putative ABC transporter ATP-binding protein YxlF [bacterium BMS3Bbin02]